MHKIYRTVFWVLLVSSFFFLLMRAEAQSNQGEDLQQVITNLIDAVAQSDLTFIRNGESHSSVEAAAHIRRKYEYFRDRIKNPQDFIRLCATKSLISDKAYEVDTPQGRITVAKWLEQILAGYLKNQNPL